jgi:aspartate aminotransferase
VCAGFRRKSTGDWSLLNWRAPRDRSLASLKLNSNLLGLNEAATVALADRVRSLQAAGRKIFALQTGDPDFPTPAPIIDAAYQAMREGKTHYCNSRGLPELREAIGQKLIRTNHAEYNPATEILVTCGGVHAYYCGLTAILNPGDEVLVPDPSWMTHVNLVGLVGGRVVRVPARPEENFLPTMASWERMLSGRTVALVLNSPSNPTGSVASRKYLGELAEFAVRRNLYVISDEVYENILYDGREHTCFSSLRHARDHCLLVNSFSKTYAMTGWRIGYLAAPERVVSQALKASQHSITNLAPFVQKAAVTALSDVNVAAATEAMTSAYARRKANVMQMWRESAGRIGLFEPQGAFYFFIDVRKLGRPSSEIAESLLNEAGVALVPGSVYGENGEGFLRMTIAAADDVVAGGFCALLDWAASRFN